MQAAIYKKSKQPHFILFRNRFQSFKDWGYNHVISSYELAKAGFFYTNINDRVQCFHCNGCLEDWIQNLEALKEHVKWLVDCEYAQLLNEDSNLVFNMNEIMSVQVLRGMWYSDGVIEKAYASFFEKGDKNPSAFQLMGAVLKIDANDFEIENVGEGILNMTLSNNSILEGEKIIKIRASYDDLQRIQIMKEENKKMKAKSYCMLCPNKRNCVYIPCGHIILCCKCSNYRIKCVYCSSMIAKIERIYLV